LVLMALTLCNAIAGHYDKTAAWARAGHRYALIYYSNDSSKAYLESPNIARLLQWLRSIPGNAAASSRATLENDVEQFSVAVAEETAAIIKAASAELGVALITNTAVLEGHYLSKAPEEKAFTSVPVTLPAHSDDVRLAGLPLDNLHVLRALLADAVKRIAADVSTAE
jgi:hypothetical protein